MNFTQSFRLAIKSLLTSKMRALLTMLGIIIGVGCRHRHHQPGQRHAADDEPAV